MDRSKFILKYEQLSLKFGNNGNGTVIFGPNKFEQIFNMFNEANLTDVEAERIIDSFIDSDFFNKHNVPNKDAFVYLIEKTVEEKNKQNFRYQKAKENLGVGWSEIKGDGLTNTLKEYGCSSISELISNKFKKKAQGL